MTPASGDERGGGGDRPAASSEALERLRARISALDDDLIRLIGERRDLVIEIGRLKGELGLPVLDPAREAKVVRKAARRARELGVDEEMTRDVIWRVIASARSEQEGRPVGWPEQPPGRTEAPDESAQDRPPEPPQDGPPEPSQESPPEPPREGPPDRG